MSCNNKLSYQTNIDTRNKSTEYSIPDQVMGKLLFLLFKDPSLEAKHGPHLSVRQVHRRIIFNLRIIWYTISPDHLGEVSSPPEGPFLFLPQYKSDRNMCHGTDLYALAAPGQPFYWTGCPGCTSIAPHAAVLGIAT